MRKACVHQLRCVGLLMVISVLTSFLLLAHLMFRKQRDVIQSLSMPLDEVPETTLKLVLTRWPATNRDRTGHREKILADNNAEKSVIYPRIPPETKTQTTSKSSARHRVTAKQMPHWGNQLIPNSTVRGYLNVHVWNGWCGSKVDDIRKNKHFPSYPDHHTITNVSYASWKETQYAQRIFGYIHPPLTGKYVFAMTSDDDSETWLSTSEHPADIRRIVLAKRDIEHFGVYKKIKTVLHSSDEIMLRGGQKYFVEILHKQYEFREYVLLGWRIPGGNSRISMIKTRYLSSYYDDKVIGDDVMQLSLHTPVTNASYNIFAHNHAFEQTPSSDSGRQRDRFIRRDEYVNSLTDCHYSPSYRISFNLTRYQGVYLVHETAVFPNDNTTLTDSQSVELCEVDRKADSHGNLVFATDFQSESSDEEFQDATTPSSSTAKETLVKTYMTRKLLNWPVMFDRIKKRLNELKVIPKWRDVDDDMSVLDEKGRKVAEEARLFGYKWSFLEKGGIFRDESLYKQFITTCRNDGNILLNDKIAAVIARNYLNAIQDMNGRKFKLNKIVNVEENHDLLNGDRYLVELDVVMDGEEFRLSDYVYQPLGSLSLCKPHDFNWDLDATIHIIVPVKNQGVWLQHFIRNMDDIYRLTQDVHFNVVVVDFSSSDINLKQYFEKSSLKRYEIVNMEGPFQRALGLQAGADAVKNENDIIFMCDLHLEIPPTILESVRKHCVEGKMVFAPVVNRLECGFSPEYPRGSWEILGYGLFGMYKSDFDAVGGMNTKEFKTTWGGEDWELVDRVLQHGLEIERLRLPNFYHHHHSKKKMWNYKEQTENYF